MPGGITGAIDAVAKWVYDTLTPSRPARAEPPPHEHDWGTIGPGWRGCRECGAHEQDPGADPTTEDYP